MNTAWDLLIGVWKLRSVQRRSLDGRIDYPYGEKPTGRLTYDNAGRMAVQLMQSGRLATTGIREALESYVAYFGTFAVDESAKTVTHYVEASLEPSWVNTYQKRTFRFDSDRLVLTAVTTSVFELTWERDTR